MRFLLDANLSWRLVKALETQKHEVTHVNQCILPQPASDKAIWNYAIQKGYVIVTKDIDFLRLSEMHGFPPQVVLVRHQNKSWRQYAEIIKNSLPDIEKAFESEKCAIVELI